MKLELKHLAGYLPYKLKGIMYYGGCVREDVELGLMDIPVWLNGSYPIKPILRPLSDLTKEDWNSVFVDSDIDNILSIYQSDRHFGCVEYYLVNILLSHHFDIYGLIENGLAIDINTLEK